MKTTCSTLLLLAVSLLFVQCSKKDVTDCNDSNAFNYNEEATINCCCEYEVIFDPEGTANFYKVTWTNEAGGTSFLSGQSNIWTASYVVTLGASVSFSVTNLDTSSTSSTSTAIANIWKGTELFKTATAIGANQTATASGIIN